jgi:hypothetical protein
MVGETYGFTLAPSLLNPPFKVKNHEKEVVRRNNWFLLKKVFDNNIKN